MNTVTIASRIRSARSDITPKNALTLARLPRERFEELRSRGLFVGAAANQTAATLRALGESR